ncbi:DUF2169 family type VI secretion system accessory protein [Pelotalea chapellei]|uniref:DUF2169 domain-containing protein n=1 Tax=Pelotalea chapellei TaxID=44671 RepID=A0ABS5UAT3_9BACT|nr:DUF2169 domain-containing protein [Pelotalea chapellei]MBT1072760.1 DUF2169 domain-containing protein [Pelotalea chapellei]
MNIINNSPFSAAPFFLMDKNGAETLLIVVKGTWSIGSDGTLTIADEQIPILSEPVYSGEPGQSSLIYDTDVVLEKPGTDCVLIGHAWPPLSGAPHVDVTFSVGPVKKQARVFGDRKWMKSGTGAASISRVTPFEKIPLCWERAFGGADTNPPDPADHQYCLENPVGRGIMTGTSKITIDGQLLPNIENPADLIQSPDQRPKPTGFGMIAPYWQPRAGFAGTYDENWRRTLNPLPPADLDPRFYSSAAPGLCTPQHLTGTEQVLVEGASRNGVLRFELPGATPRASVRLRQREDDIPLRLDTVIVEPDEARLVLIWRGTANVHGKVNEIYSVRVE